MALDAARVVFEAREAVAGFFGVPDAAQVAFTANATHALNIALHGLLQAGDHVITTALEHNSVMRPLRAMAGVTITVLPGDPTGAPDLAQLDALMRPNTKLVVVTHGSNVTGRVLPVRAIGAVCRRRGVLFLVDAAQTAGCVPLNMTDDQIDLLAFTGHKGLLGPQGTGGLCINTCTLPTPLYQGGSGSHSESECHPMFMPDRLEAGTLNTVGIAGLHAGIQWVEQVSLPEIARREARLRTLLVEGLQTIPGVRLYAGDLPIVSLTVDGVPPDRVGLRLERDFGILTRVGLHCAPSAHRAIGTAPAGTVRLSLGYANTEAEVAVAVAAVAELAKGGT